jgi:hypothetical protein
VKPTHTMSLEKYTWQQQWCSVSQRLSGVKRERSPDAGVLHAGLGGVAPELITGEKGVARRDKSELRGKPHYRKLLNLRGPESP